MWGMRGRLTAGLPLAAVALVLALFYSWTASNGKALGLGQPQDAFYNLMTDALLHGQLHLREEPEPGLFEMAEPYEPSRNVHVRVHDASLYKGRYYLYFGVVPALLLFVPWRLVGLGDLPESLAAVLFGMAGFIIWACLLRRLIRTHFPGTPAWARTVGYITLGLASVVPFALRGASVYEVAITAGYAFLAGATWFFITAGDGGRLSLARLALGGLLLGLAVGCRPNHVALIPVLPLLAWPTVRRAGTRARAALAVLLPLGACLLLLGAYNKARFDSWLDFGTRYQLGGMRPVPWFDPRAVPAVVWFQFLAPPHASLDFPFFLPRTDYPWETPEGFFKEPSVTGALAHSPFLLILLAAVPLLRGARAPASQDLRWRVLVLSAAGLTGPLLTALVFSAAAMRYQVDFVPFLLVPALLLWLLALEQAGGRRRAALAALGLAAIGWSWLLAVTLSLSGNYDVLRRRNPDLWQALEQEAEPLRVSLGRLLDRDGRLPVHMRIAFPERAAAAAEPLLSWGRVDAWDALWVRQLGPGQFSFSLQTSAGHEDSTPALHFEAGRFYDLALDLDRVRRRVRATREGAPLFELRGRLVPVHPNRLWSSRGPKGHDAPNLGCFSGTVVPEAMMLAGPPGLESLPPLAPLPALYTEGTEPPPAASPGQLWVPAAKPGVFVSTGGGWRWLPRCFLDRLLVRRPITLGSPRPGTVEPLLSWGDGQVFDAVFVRHLGGRRVAFGLAQARDSWTFGATGPEATGSANAAPHELSILLDRVEGRLRVDLDGREVLSTHADLAPLGRAFTRLGALPPGRPFEPGTSGGPLPPTRDSGIRLGGRHEDSENVEKE
jgi:hypothetical protein